MNLLDKITSFFSMDTGSNANATVGDLLNTVPFSLEEQDTGRTWIDGKPIFRQVFALDGLGDNVILIAAGVITDMQIRELAVQLVRRAPPKDWQREIEALFNFVRNNVRYVRDIHAVETVQTPAKTLEFRAGDCDDMVTLLAAMLLKQHAFRGHSFVYSNTAKSPATGTSATPRLNLTLASALTCISKTDAPSKRGIAFFWPPPSSAYP